MMDEITVDERDWLSTNHPKLILFPGLNQNLIQGSLDFNRVYEEALSDSYKIRLEIPHGSKKPKLFETGNRIRGVYDSRPRLKSLADIHAYDTWSLCYAAPQELALKYLIKPDIRVLIRDYIEPYFYSQSYFEKYDEWPWEHLPHNTKGLIEWYIDNHELPGAATETERSINELAQKGDRYAIKLLARGRRCDSFSPAAHCLCGKKRSYMNCHRTLIKLAYHLRKKSIR